MEEIKHALRIDNVTLEHKPLFDKAVMQETLGFFGYSSGDVNYRVYQDSIRFIFEEILSIQIPENFHFLQVPLYHQQAFVSLEDVSTYFFDGNSIGITDKKNLYPITLSLYGNHKTHGMCPARRFSQSSVSSTFQDLVWLFETLGIDQEIYQSALKIGLEKLGEDHKMLLQFFDISHFQGDTAYATIDRIAYPGYASGHPFENSSVSSYCLTSDKTDLPPQIFLILTDHIIGNPSQAIAIKRYAKIQPSILKSYEEELRNIFKKASYDEEKKDLYLEKLQQAWSR